MSKRLITKKQEKALRLCHQDFQGLDQVEAAKQMGITQQAISKLLTAVEKILPQYFPILTKLEAKCYHLFIAEGWPVDDIAEHFGLTPNSVYKTLRRIKDKGMFFTEAKGRVLSYNSNMDANVKEQF
jgi:predicted DNA-binding protein YlxM (UPF0122 family)